jgi:Desulfoferrodoxin, N-terminal domain
LEVNLLAKKKGEKYKCEDCGLIVVVEDDCGCEECDIVCCGAPMKPVKETKSKPETKPKPVITKPKKK